MADLSLQSTLTRRLLAVLSAVVLMATVSAYVLGGLYVDLIFDRTLFDDVATLGSQVEFRDGEARLLLPPAARALLLADEAERVIYRVIDLDRGTVIDGNGDLGAWNADAKLEGQPYFRDVISGGAVFRVAYARHNLDPADKPLLIEVGETRSKRDRARREILVGVLGLMLLLSTAAVVLLRQGIAQALAPLQDLEAEAALRSGDNLAPLNPLLAPREARSLIEAVNRMMQRVATLVQSQRSFVANASHQLRTPIAGVRLQAQLALKSNDAQATAESLKEIETSAARAAHLIDQLLVLSAADGDDFAASQCPVDLAHLAQTVLEAHVEQAHLQGVRLSYEGLQQGPVVEGNPTLLGELLGNLLDNAIRYHRAGGCVAVLTALSDQGAMLGVSDNGTGLSRPAGELFVRFNRSDDQRGGAGLGLAIVQEIAQRHSAWLRVRSDAASGTCIEVIFPPA